VTAGKAPANIETTPAVAVIRDELSKTSTRRGRRIGEKLAVAAVGAIPWVGGLIAALAAIPLEERAARRDSLQVQWLEEHEGKLSDLKATLESLHLRIAGYGPNVEARVESSEYLTLAGQAFRTWDTAATAEKRQFTANLVANAAGTRICSDDIVRLFLSWLDGYHENHFAVISEIFNNPGSTRYDIWVGIYGDEVLPRDDSAEADLYKMLIRDLSTGGVIRQVRDTTEAGQFVRKRPAKRRVGAPTTMESAFEDTKTYTLTELGRQFVHYTMNEAIGELGTKADD